MKRGWPLGKRRGVATVPSAAQAAPLGAVVIPLTRGWVAWVDSADAPTISRWCWHARVGGTTGAVAWRKASQADKDARSFVVMANAIIKPPAGMCADHLRYHQAVKVIDNRRCNLILATKQQNTAGKRKTSAARSSIFKGVTWDRARLRWAAKLTTTYRTVNIGRFTNEGHAALAYDAAAMHAFGEHALTNFPAPGSRRWLYGGFSYG